MVAQRPSLRPNATLAGLVKARRDHEGHFFGWNCDKVPVVRFDGSRHGPDGVKHGFYSIEK